VLVAIMFKKNFKVYKTM